MLSSCARSCGSCVPLKKGGSRGGDGDGVDGDADPNMNELCKDHHEHCGMWAENGECSVNSECELVLEYECMLCIHNHHSAI